MRLIPLSEIALAVDATVPTGFTDEIRKTIQMAVLSTIRKMNLVSREEVEEQEKKVLQLNEKIEALEGLVALLQKQKRRLNGCGLRTKPRQFRSSGIRRL